MIAPSRNITEEELVRIRLLLLMMLLAFGLLAAAMWRVQVAKGHHYQRDLVKQSVRRVRQPGMRGRIFDRNGICLADNRPSYCIAVYLEELRQMGGWTRTIDRVEIIVKRLSQVLRIPPQITRDDIAKHVRLRLPLPLLAWRDVDPATLARFSERAAQVPGVGVHIEAVRTYPYGAVTAHTVGRVGRADPVKDEEHPFHYYLPEMAGRVGIEQSFDGVLRGQAGGRLVRVDVAGFRHEDLGHLAPRAGSDVLLSIDARIQKVAEDVLGEESGACVVVDPRSGDLLALASSPSYDPNAFIPAISSRAWSELHDDPRQPLLNRAVAGAYAPGSTFKPVVALAALENGLATGGTRFECPGYLDLGKARFRCWTRGRHGELNMREALQHSCNVYFYRLGLQAGHEYIYHMATALGLGRKTGVSLGYEVPGLVPNDAWVRKTYGHGWRAGDTCNFSIGQGALATTPLQMAMVTATIANGGRVYRPRLVKGIREEGMRSFRAIPVHKVNDMNWSKASLDIVRSGMRDVVMSARGTGRLARVPDLVMAGKTGTAEYGKKEEGKKHAWMIAFAPFDDPRYAVAVVLEDAISGGVTAAPRIKELMTSIFDEDGKEGEG